MSGYLQRLTSAVRNSDRAIRPVLGSVFSSPTNPRMRQSLAEENITSLTTGIESQASASEEQGESSGVRSDLPAQPSSASSRGDALGPLVPAVPFQPLTMPTERPQASVDATRDNRNSFRPLVSTWEHRTEKLAIPSFRMNYEDAGSRDRNDLGPGEVEHAAAEAGSSDSRASSLPPATSVSSEARRNESLEAASEGRTSLNTLPAKAPTEPVERNERVSRNAYRPLLAENLGRMTPEVFPAASNAIPSDAKRKDARDEARHAREPAPREPDEIQIHIGRIEVVAVPPPAPVREARPTHKPVSLDDYLKRSNGSTR